MKYRPDIDGLRAIAVLSVVLFHIDDRLAPGGFIGVDIFFVISGYLISLQIFKEIDAGSFSIAEFYRKRVKRIAPAMLVVLATTLVISQFLFRPEDAENVARSAFWSLLSLANVHFWLFEDASYFATSSDELPLLHFWSLGVEEQFYLFWPIILLLCSRFIRLPAFALSAFVVAIASFAFAQAYFHSDPAFVYYMLPARAGELLAGAIVAWFVNTRGHESLLQTQNQILATIGLVLTIGSLYLLSGDIVFPGFSAIPSTVGTAALIYSGGIGPTWVSRILTVKAMVWLGLVSYSAYLWHWPILAYLRYGQIEMTWAVGTAVIALTLILAAVSYRYVETPFRRSRRSVLRILGWQYVAPSLFLGAFAAISLKADGTAIHRFFPNYMDALETTRMALRPALHLDYVCQRQLVTPDDLVNPDCVVGKSIDHRPHAILWGDSNAAHYIGMMKIFGDTAGFTFRNIQVGNCPPIAGDPSKYVSTRRRGDCRASNSQIWPIILEFKTAIVSAAWPSYQEKSSEFLDDLTGTLDRLNAAGVHVILLGKAPIISGYDRLCQEKALRLTGMDCHVEPVALAHKVIETNKRLQNIAATRLGVDYFDANDYLCPDNRCSLKDKGGTVMYYDSSHLTADASVNLGRQIVSESGVPPVFLRLGEGRDIRQEYQGPSDYDVPISPDPE